MSVSFPSALQAAPHTTQVLSGRPPVAPSTHSNVQPQFGGSTTTAASVSFSGGSTIGSHVQFADVRTTRGKGLPQGWEDQKGSRGQVITRGRLAVGTPGAESLVAKWMARNLHNGIDVDGVSKVGQWMERNVTGVVVAASLGLMGFTKRGRTA